MLKNNLINRQIVRKIATALGDLNHQVVFVGGAVVCLYINDPAADEIRPTKDVDVFLEIVSLKHLEEIRKKLRQHGFLQTPEDNVICRFRFDEIKVDVMSTREIGWAPANPWFEPGFNHIEVVDIDGQQVSILPLPYFLATKFSAYHNRGGLDPRTSHDFEDIVYILNNQTDIVRIILNSPSDVRKYLKNEFSKMLNNNLTIEAIRGNLFYEMQEERFSIIKNRLLKMI
jgi:predicted nucleotidyltransferase